MNLSVLLDRFQQSPRLFQLADEAGFADTQKSSSKFTGQQCWVRGEQHFLCIRRALVWIIWWCSTMRETQPIFTIPWRILRQRITTFLFPGFFQEPQEFQTAQLIACNAATGADKAFAGGNKIIITYPEALFESSIAQNSSGNIISIRTNDTSASTAWWNCSWCMDLNAQISCMNRASCIAWRYSRYLFFWQWKALPRWVVWQRGSTASAYSTRKRSSVNASWCR